MAGENSVKLHGMWASSYSKRVELALKIKGIPYEYIEEDLSNKSELLLKYNPAHKKVPVLVHNGKPIAESAIILEYIDETWTNSPRLLPEDPYQKAKVRFWVSFIQQQLFECIGRVVMSDGEEREKAFKEVFEELKVLEDGVKEYFPDSNVLCINEENLGLLDIIICATFSPHRAAEEAIGVKILDPTKNPLIFSWVTALNELPLVKELLPPHDKLVSVVRLIRQNALNSST
ncbi:putative Glutathione s-transferase [Quillaja saponaria]|uniref:Glutathione S-transferase n=1 Tax=Quillaja saponaria TaxID=32244 RepID=A0AAD7LEA9_QUISA|nr:putative Glutathione s-transferase [Quillaja saponaria]